MNTKPSSMNDESVADLDMTGWPLPDRFLIEIGRITALWISLEQLLNICLGKLSGFNNTNDPTPFILTNHASFPQRLDMLGALCEVLEPAHPSLAGYKDVIGLLRNAQRERNKYSHNGISASPGGNEYVIAFGSARGSVKTNVEKITENDIQKAVVQISIAQRSLYKLVLRREVPPPWRQKSK